MRTRKFPVAGLAIILVITLSGCDESKGPGVECGPVVPDCGGNQSVNIGETVTLVGDFSPTQDDPICREDGVLWIQVAGPPVTIQDADQMEATFVPTAAGVHMFRFEADFPWLEDPQEICVIRVNVVDPGTCGAPTADAGPDQTVGTPTGAPVSVTLDGTASHAVNQEGCDLSLIGYSWTVVNEPAGSAVVIRNAGLAQASVDLSVLGVYEFQFEVQDDGGTDGRTDTAVDTVSVTVVEEVCGTGLDVTVIEAATGDALAGATVRVVDAAGASYSAAADASGLASFTGLEEGRRQSITASSADMVVPLPPAGPDRPKYEATTVLDQCGTEITIPVRRTASGERAGEWGTVVVKVPRSLFDVLPHSWRCTRDCFTDADCDGNYYCESDPATPCGPAQPGDPGRCTPRSLLPSFSLGSPDISGQFRVVMVVPLLEGENFTYRDLDRIFAPPPESGDIWPGNLATDDSFLNPLAPSFGRDIWGDTCLSTYDCPNTTDYICEEDPTGTHRCEDKNPLRNIRLDLPAGISRYVLVMGIIDIYVDEFLPGLLSFLTTGQYGPDLPTHMLASFDMHTLHVCPLSATVTAAQDNDISYDLSFVRSDDCWNVDYQTREVVVTTPGGATLYRVEIVTNDRISVEPDFSDFDPTAVNADTRLCSWLPATAPYEVMCDLGGYIGPCSPPEIHDIPLPPDTECSFPYGMGLTALDVPVGNAKVPEGGRVFTGFEFNRCKTHQNFGAEYLVPVEALDGSVMLSATQMYFRNLRRTDLGPFWEMPGYLLAQDRWANIASTVTLPPLMQVPALDPPPPDAGLSVEVNFDSEDPTVWPDPVWKRVFAAAIGPRMPQAGTHEMTYGLTETTLSGEDLKGVVLSKVDYAAAITYVDNWWRVYLPAGASGIALPEADSPFASGDDVWITPFGAGFGGVFDYDQFPTDVLLGPMSQYSEDSWAVIVP